MKLNIALLVIGLICIISGLLTWSELTNYPSGEALSAWMGFIGGLFGAGGILFIVGVVRIVLKKRS